MPDLHDLDDFSQGLPPMDHLPPSAIRTRGDRLRRRRTALTAAGGVLVAALAIGTPVVALSGGDGGRDTTEFATSGPSTPGAPAPEPVTTVPAGFPLGAGMGTSDDPANQPHVGTEPGEVVLTSIEVCGREAWALDSPTYPTTDALGAVWSDGVEGGEQRTLATYDGEQSAQRALGTIGSTIAECGAQEVRGSGFAIEPRRLDSSAGEESLAYVDRYLDKDGYTGEANVFVLVRVGNALLIDKTYVGGAGDLSVADDTVRLLTERSAEVVDAMCVFAAEGC